MQKLPENESALTEFIGRKRGCLRSGKQLDIEKTSKILIAELRSGTIGKFTLETPELIEKELLELSVLRENKAVKKSARKNKWKESK